MLLYKILMYFEIIQHNYKMFINLTNNFFLNLKNLKKL